MTTLRRSGPAIAAPGTLVAPEAGVALAPLAQIVAEGYHDQDAASVLITQWGTGEPVTTGDDPNTSLFYVDLDTKILYFRVTFDPITYCPIGGASQPSNNPATGVPRITGSPHVGETLTAGVGSISDIDGLPSVTTFGWQWLRNDVDIPAAAGQSYLVDAADLGESISVRASFVDSDGNAEARTSAGIPITDPANNPATGSPTITGTVDVGETLTAAQGTIADTDGIVNINISWRWLRNGASIPGANTNTYEIQNSDRGFRLSARASFNDDLGHAESRTSAQTTRVPQVAEYYLTAKLTRDIEEADFLVGVNGASPLTLMGLVAGDYYLGVAGRGDLAPVSSINAFFEERASFDPAVGALNDEIMIGGIVYNRYVDQNTRQVSTVNSVPYGIS